MVGFAKSLDRDPENLQHRLLATVTGVSKFRNGIIFKEYAGFNPGISYEDTAFTADSIGLNVVKAFLDPGTSRFKKPTYIDVKHMDVEGRIQYYYMRRRYEQQFKMPIPIIASHFAVSGENQAMAAATGLWPYFDKYREVENVSKFYRKRILKRNNAAKREDAWEDIMGEPGSIYNKNKRSYYDSETGLDSFDRAMYKPMNFIDPNYIDNKVYDPFAKFKLENDKVGWYYPWSINLFDEEIIEINKSDGILGLMLDPRQLGAFMDKYKKIKKNFGAKFRELKRQLELKPQELGKYGMTPADINENEYFKTEPLIRNLFYIVKIIRQRKKDEAAYISGGNKKPYDDYIEDTAFLKHDAWEFISIGGDFDGYTDPIDYASTAAYIPVLKSRMIVYAWIFAQMHKDQFNDPITGDLLITSLDDSAKKMQLIFYENGQKFIKKYF